MAGNTNTNTNLSTLLLLGVLIFLIYCLMKQPSQDKPNVVSNQDNQEDVENFEAISERELSESSASSVSSTSRPKQESVRKPTDFSSKNADVPVMSEGAVNKLIAESNNKSAVNSTLLGTGSSVFSFEPNDDNTYTGASLENAFERPVPESADTDVVDLNKNNVVNYSASDYLPKEVNDDWFNTDFSQAKYKMNDDKLINTDKYIIGINTVGQSLKNASYDIRGSVNVPKYTVSPWNNSTIEPDYNIKPLC
jgi:hypothetical protein